MLPAGAFLRRSLRCLGWSAAIITAALLIGVLGYRFIGDLEWIDAVLNAAMILTGMGPVDRLGTDAGKLFAAFYALFSGLVFISTVAVLLAPFIHRLLHALHLEEQEDA